ncbi:tyrosine-type recombinase/integrase [Shewanella waksmanii]|uniref:tyrosine-type recombinase/integrase n=1 Tax=Shewanella waksmanii TaxID=213783 RepID=UPI0004BCD58F|nr:site-specific integrase [Shewanella waksmanii]
MTPFAMPLFENAATILTGNQTVNDHITHISLNQVEDAGLIYQCSCELLYCQKDNENSFKSYRSELTTFLNWCFSVAKLSPAALKRQQISQYIDYCLNPPIELVGYFNVAQFIKFDVSSQIPNPKWKPFIGKKHDGIALPYQLSDNALKTKVAILSSFYNYLISEEVTERNPAQAWLNHSRFASKARHSISNDDSNQMAFTELQWSYIIATAEKLALQEPEAHQRSLFLIKLVYSCYLRVSDVSARAGYSPIMGQFKLNKHSNIWQFYLPKSKGQKSRYISVSKALLQALQDYRRYLGLVPYPSPTDETPLFVRHRPAGRGREAGTINANLGIRQIRDIIEFIIENAAKSIESDDLYDDAVFMRKMSAHSIRHTGITHDININQRPLSHVQADAGHESIDTTSLYLHTLGSERDASAANKPLDVLAGIE